MSRPKLDKPPAARSAHSERISVPQILSELDCMIGAMNGDDTLADIAAELVSVRRKLRDRQVLALDVMHEIDDPRSQDRGDSGAEMSLDLH